jgi:trimeric autotransporter adhesin
MMRARIVFFLTIGAATILSACGGGGGGGGTPPVTQTATPSPAPTSESTTAALSTSTTASVSFAKIANGASLALTLPTVSTVATASMTFQTGLPSTVATPSMRALKSREAIGGSNLQTFAVLTLGVSTTTALTSTPAFAFTLSSAPSGDAYVAYFDENNPGLGWNVLLGPGTISGNTVTFAAQQLTLPVTLVTGDTYVFALILSSTPASTATSLSYTGTKTINYSYGFAFGYPSPAPSATAPPTTLSYSVSASVSEGSSPYPSAAPSGVIDEHVAESDTGSLESLTYATDSWIGITTGATWDELLYGTTQQEPSSDNEPVTTTLYTSAQQTDQFPATSGASWTNAPAATIVYTYADGDNGTRTVNPDGSYVDTENLLASGAGGTAVLTENSDGSGSIASSALDYGFLSSITFSAPTSSGITITFNYSQAAQNEGAPATATATDTVWYAQPLVLYSETDSIKTSASLPAACNAPFGITTANDVNRTVTSIDTVVGFEDQSVVDSYEYSGIPLCLLTTDTQSYAYDEQQNTPYLLLYGALGVEVVKTQETLTLQTAPSAVAASANRPFGPALAAHVLDVYAGDRATRVRALVNTIGGKR